MNIVVLEKDKVFRNIADLFVLSRTFDRADLRFVPQSFSLSVYEQDAMPGVIGALTNYPIATVRARWMVGRVFSFDALPMRKSDPVIIVCKELDLRAYYRAWAALIHSDSWKTREHIGEYDEAIRCAIRSARTLDDNELHFAIFEMLNFRNRMLGRGNHELVHVAF